jgi:hypothetical protein
VRESFAKRPLLRRVVALAAAYAIALSGLIASFGAVRGAVADAASLGIVICQPTLLGQTAPGNHNSDRDRSSFVGCPVLLGAVPPPPMSSIAAEQSSGRLLALPAIIDLPSATQTKSHRSRAPPRAA